MVKNLREQRDEPFRRVMDALRSKPQSSRRKVDELWGSFVEHPAVPTIPAGDGDANRVSKSEMRGKSRTRTMGKHKSCLSCVTVVACLILGLMAAAFAGQVRQARYSKR